MEIRFQRLDKSSFNERSLDGFERRQTVRMLAKAERRMDAGSACL